MMVLISQLLCFVRAKCRCLWVMGPASGMLCWQSVELLLFADHCLCTPDLLFDLSKSLVLLLHDEFRVNGFVLFTDPESILPSHCVEVFLLCALLNDWQLEVPLGSAGNWNQVVWFNLWIWIWASNLIILNRLIVCLMGLPQSHSFMSFSD